MCVIIESLSVLHKYQVSNQLNFYAHLFCSWLYQLITWFQKLLWKKLGEGKFCAEELHK